ncbi:MAG: GAF domain-containing protein, partial [Chloroflexi bacterium]|nr:GAF domain-containing protein [Chloroflexota bacterium]
DVYIDTTPTPDEVSLTSSVLEAGRPLAVIDVCNTPYINEKLAAEYPCTSALGLPLMAGERKLGAVILGYEKEYKFSESEIQRSELAAREISLAMMKILSVEDSRQRVREMTGLYEISQTFGLHSEPRLTYGLLTERLASLLGAEMCLVAIKINETNEISARLPAFGVSDEVASRLSYPVSMGAGVWDFSKMGVFRANRPEEIPPQFGKLAADNGIHSVLAAPLWDPNRNLLGMVFAANKQAGFNPSDARLMNIFTAQASVVIQNMNLLTAERRRSKELSVLHDVAQAVTSNDEEKELIVQLAQMIGRNLFPDNFGILLMDEVNNVLHSDGSYFFEDQETQVSFPLDSGITGRVATTGIAIRSGDVTKCEYYVALNERIRSELCVPVKVGERVIGVINAESVLSNAFSQEDEKLLTIIAGQLATAIERLRARQAEDHQTAQVKRSNAFIKALAHVGARASAAADPDSVMQTLGSELTKLGLSCLLALNEPETGRTTIHYTSIHPRIVRLIERVSRRRMRDFVMDLERLAPLVESLHEPALLYDPLVIARQALQDFPEDALRKALRPTGVDENIPICHLPLVYEGKSLGFLWLWGEGLHKSDLPTISIFSSQVAIALENASLMAEVKRLAITDEGTDIFN